MKRNDPIYIAIIIVLLGLLAIQSVDSEPERIKQTYRVGYIGGATNETFLFVEEDGRILSVTPVSLEVAANFSPQIVGTK